MVSMCPKRETRVRVPVKRRLWLPEGGKTPRTIMRARAVRATSPGKAQRTRHGLGGGRGLPAPLLHPMQPGNRSVIVGAQVGRATMPAVATMAGRQSQPHWPGFLRHEMDGGWP